MMYAYLRVSFGKLSAENQRYEVLKFADTKKLSIDHWIEETMSGTKKMDKRKLGKFLEFMQEEKKLLAKKVSYSAIGLADRVA